MFKSGSRKQFAAAIDLQNSIAIENVAEIEIIFK